MSAPTPIQRLATALRAASGGRAELISTIATHAGADPRLARRACIGRDINADAYLKLCRALLIDPVTGESDARGCGAPPVGNLDWTVLALALKGQRMLRDQSIAKAKKTISGISDATISRVENGQGCSIDHLLLICAYIGRHPYSLCSPFPVKHGVKDIERKEEKANA